MRGGFEAGEDEPSSFINSRSLVSFASEVRGQNRKDLLNSTLFAQLAADYDFPGMADPMAWFKRYTGLLSEIGYNLQGGEERIYSSGVHDFDMNKALLKIMGVALGGPVTQLALITSTLDALKELGKDADDIKIFERRVQALQTNSFQIGSATEVNEAVALTLSTFRLNTYDGTRRILFFKAGKDTVELTYSVTTATLNEDVYGRVRNDIVEQLGDAAAKSIRGIKLAAV